VNNSSQEPIYTITLDDNEDTNHIPNNVITWGTSSIPALTTSDIITLTGTAYGSGSTTYSNIETIDLSKIDSFSSFTNFYKEEFDGRFPDFDRVQEMCKEYPGLEIAYKKFKEVYKLVKEDYDGKERERRGLK
jgi:hypothetical protein